VTAKALIEAVAAGLLAMKTQEEERVKAEKARSNFCRARARRPDRTGRDRDRLHHLSLVTSATVAATKIAAVSRVFNAYARLPAGAFTTGALLATKVPNARALPATKALTARALLATKVLHT